MSGRVVALRFEVVTIDAVASWSSVPVVRGEVFGLGAGSTAVPVFYNVVYVTADLVVRAGLVVRLDILKVYVSYSGVS